MNKAKRLQMRLTPAEHELITKAGEITGLGMSEFIRATSLAGARAIVENDTEKWERIMRSTGQMVFASMAIQKDT